MQLHLFNTASKQKELFKAIDPSHIKMYVCGPTVYNYIHIGNARPAVVFDCLFRLLQNQYAQVSYARNITDVDDKINAAAAEQGVSITEFAEKFTQAYQDDMAKLGNLVPTMQPKATDHIQEMLDMIATLIEKGHAYESDGHVLFSVDSLDTYGSLSNRQIEDMVAGARVEVASYKRNAMDFVLWKPSVDQQPGWESPFGFGRPGWHTECVAMIYKHLGKSIDIHGGGRDLVFPHHENELAQGNCCGEANQPYVNYWVHNGMINIGGEKMSKSLGNFITVRELLEQHDGELLRFALLSAHYRSTLNWTDELLEQCQSGLDKFYGVLRHVQDVADIEVNTAHNPVAQALLDDLNSPEAIAALHELASKIHKCEPNDPALEELKAFFKQGAELLGLLTKSVNDYFTAGDGISAQEIEQFIEQRANAKKAKDFAKADDIRQQLLKLDVEIQDTREGTRWQRIK